MAFTPETRRALDAFDATHELATLGRSVYYRATALPHAGGALDQDAWLTQALVFLRECHDGVLRERERLSSPPSDS